MVYKISSSSYPFFPFSYIFFFSLEMCENPVPLITLLWFSSFCQSCPYLKLYQSRIWYGWSHFDLILFLSVTVLFGKFQIAFIFSPKYETIEFQFYFNPYLIFVCCVQKLISLPNKVANIWFLCTKKKRSISSWVTCILQWVMKSWNHYNMCMHVPLSFALNENELFASLFSSFPYSLSKSNFVKSNQIPLFF